MRDIPGFEGRYAITEDGRIWSHKRIGRGGEKTGRWLKLSTDKYGYFKIVLNGNGPKTYLVHRLVAITYLPNPDNLPVVNHKDNNPENNSYLNLEWCTQKQNVQHAVKQGRNAVGERCSLAKLTASQVLEIRNQPNTQAESLAKQYNISKGQIWYIRAGKVWAHL